ncbi:MAG: ABC transporter ATP-binding protein [Xanthobacteraceae bacterium]
MLSRRCARNVAVEIKRPCAIAPVSQLHSAPDVFLNQFAPRVPEPLTLDPTVAPAVIPALELRGVGHVFPAHGAGEPVRALTDVSLSIPVGEFFAIIGPSGCGKSTLLDIISGILPAQEGEVLFERKPVHGEVPEGIGVVFQEDAAFPWLTVRENVAFGLRHIGIDQAELGRRVDHAIRFMGLTSFAEHRPPQLSGGMRQRVCIARTLVLQPRLILLDEPFGALDQQTRLLMGEELLRLWRETHATVLLITHSLDEAAMLADRVGVMSARPGHFVDVLTTHWPRERDSRVVSEPGFGDITARLWSILRVESMKAIGGSDRLQR